MDRATAQAMERAAEARRTTERRRHLAFAPEAPLSAIPSPVPARILVVDDEPLVRGLLETALTMGGYEVLVADSGAAALERLEEAAGTIDLVITDTRMPGMSGWELITRIRARWPGQRLLRTSGYYSEAEELAAGAAADAVAFLPKPFLPEELVRHVAVLLGR